METEHLLKGSNHSKETEMPLFGKVKVQVYFPVTQRVRAHLKIQTGYGEIKKIRFLCISA